MPRDDRANWHPPSDRLGPQLVAALRMLLALSWRARRSASARADRRCWPPARWEPRPGWPAPPWTVTPVGGLTALGPILLGEVSPGGVGTGLYAMLVFVLLTVFLAGLMVGRTPKYLGKKLTGQQTTLVALYLLILPLVVLGFSAVSAVLPSALDSRLNPGMHGLTEIVYAFASAANGNGSAFAGLSANTAWYNTTLGLTMLAGRYLTIVPVLALAGSMARVRVEASSPATLATHGPVFVTFHLAVVLLLGGLSYLPMLVLGLVGESITI